MGVSLLLITSQECADNMLELVVYPVGDIALPSDRSTSPPDFDSLIEACIGTVHSTSWDNVGGPGSIAGLESGLCLVVSQTQAVHREIGQWLADLRRLPPAKFPASKPKGQCCSILGPAGSLPNKPEEKK